MTPEQIERLKELIGPSGLADMREREPIRALLAEWEEQKKVIQRLNRLLGSQVALTERAMEALREHYLPGACPDCDVIFTSTQREEEP